MAGYVIDLAEADAFLFDLDGVLTSLFDAQVDGLGRERLDLPGKPAPDAFVEAARRLRAALIESGADVARPFGPTAATMAVAVLLRRAEDLGHPLHHPRHVGHHHPRAHRSRAHRAGTHPGAPTGPRRLRRRLRLRIRDGCHAYYRGSQDRECVSHG
ncbi:MAG TPA: hypothetical protein VF406_21060 [Thermodesulfobacteriota bacterium]